MDGKVPKVAALVLNWNGYRNTIECCETLRVSSHSVWHLVIVENGSTDDSPEQLQTWLSAQAEQCRTFSVSTTAGSARVLQCKNGQADISTTSIMFLPTNLGFTGGCNIGLQFLLFNSDPPDYIAILNNDGRLQQSTIEHLVRAAEMSGAGIVAGMIVDPRTGAAELVDEVPLPVAVIYFLSFVPPVYRLVNSVWRWLRQWRGGGQNQLCFTGRVWGPLLLVRREVLHQIHEKQGRFLNEDLFMYGDETDLSYFTRKLGWRLVSNRESVYFHPIGRKEHPRIYYYSTRNAFHLARLMMPLPMRLLFYAVALSFFSLSAMRHWLLGGRRFATARLAGILDGLGHVTGKWTEH